MSESMTDVTLPDERGLLMLHGHVPPAEAVAQARRVYVHKLAEAREALEALDAGTVRVFHQRGIWRVRHRREVSNG